MQKAIKFKLFGKTAFFKKPEVNEYAYFTYNNIHKIALLGMLGAIIGLGGYNQQQEENYPEFYEKLKDLKIAIVPDKKLKGIYPKKIQTFNNSVGYASNEEGGNLIIREQWLENPSWTIYFYNDGTVEEEIYQRLKQYLLHGKTVYIPYLGKNDHPASITEVEEITLQETGLDYIDSIFTENIEIDSFDSVDELPYYIKEIQPIKLEEQYNFYEYDSFIYTNYYLKDKIDGFRDDEINLYFF